METPVYPVTFPFKSARGEISTGYFGSPVGGGVERLNKINSYFAENWKNSLIGKLTFFIL